MTVHLDLPDALERAALTMEDDARRAAYDTDDSTLCCWQVEKVGGQTSIIEVRLDANGATDLNFVAVPATGGVAEHIAASHPRAMAKLAVLLRNQAKTIRDSPLSQRDTQLNRDLRDFLDAYVTERHD